jgi:serine O-acetyltransferase
MKTDTPLSGQCENDPQTLSRFYAALPEVVEALLASSGKEGSFDQLNAAPAIPQEAVVDVIFQARRILFPGYFTQSRIDPFNLEYYLGKETTGLFEKLSRLIILAIRHDCLKHGNACTRCTRQGHEKALGFIKTLPRIRALLSTDVRAAFEGDPAAKSYHEIILSYPGLFAIIVYRMAHVLHGMGISLLPRMMSEYAHSDTGIDIHPGAKIGRSFFIDHGTGVVVGETTEIGDRVRIYQGVTLGALSLSSDMIEAFRSKKRHPTLEDDVVIYSNATLLGEKAVIGARSIIGGNVWITDAVPPDTKVLLKQPELVYIGNSHTKGTYTRQRRKKCITSSQM